MILKIYGVLKNYLEGLFKMPFLTQSSSISNFA